MNLYLLNIIYLYNLKLFATKIKKSCILNITNTPCKTNFFFFILLNCYVKSTFGYKNLFFQYCLTIKIGSNGLITTKNEKNL